MSERPASALSIVTVMSAGFGLVGIDRFLISTLFPVIARDLNLNYTDIGAIAGALALAWGFSALCMGNLADRIGRRVVLAMALLLFSLLIGASGLAAGLAGLIVVRVIMGFADGAFTPASIAAVLDASSPRTRGRNIGVQQAMMPLLGLGVAPYLVIFLLHYMDWRWIFSIFVLPGLALAYAAWRVIPPKPPAPQQPAASPFADWSTLLRYPRIRACMAMMLCWLTCLITTSALFPSYLLDFLRLTPPQMGVVMSAIGIGAAAGTLLLPALSDWTGRKPIMLAATLGTALSLLCLAHLGPAPAWLFAALFCVHFCNNALITLTVGPICVESVPPALMTTAAGLVIATGEFFGGGIAPVLGGQIAQHFGIRHLLALPIATSLAGLALCATLPEPNAESETAHGHA